MNGPVPDPVAVAEPPVVQPALVEEALAVIPVLELTVVLAVALQLFAPVTVTL